MIVWVDGSHGIGKTSTVDALLRVLSKKSVTSCSSDEFYGEIGKEEPSIMLFGYPPQMNRRFMKLFEELIEAKLQEYEIVLVDMSLVGSKLKQEPFRYFAERGYKIYHFILYASIDILKLRIEGDENRDQQYALAWVNDQEELLSDCSNSYIIDTTELNPDDTAKKIASIVFG